MSNVLFISLYPLHEIGGGERFTFDACRSVMRSTDSCSAYACDRVVGGDAPLQDRLASRLLPIDPGAVLGNESISFRQLLIDMGECDVIWIHQYLSSPLIYDLLANTAGDQHVILTSLGHEPEAARFRACFQPCANITVVEISDFAADRVRHLGSRVRGVSAGLWKQELAPEVIAKNARQVCSVGRILPHKGVEVTLAGVPEGCTLKIVGPSKDPVYAEYLATTQTAANVEFLGEVTDHVKNQVVRSSEILVASSTEFLYYGHVIPQAELLGLVILEAVAVGTIPIVSDTPSFVEVMTYLNLAEFIYPRRDSQRLRQIIQTTLSMSLRARTDLIADAQRQLQKRFLWDDYWHRVKQAADLPQAMAQTI